MPMSNCETISCTVLLLAPVLEHLNRDNYALRNNIKMICSVDMSTFVHRTENYTFAQLRGPSEEMLLQAQVLLWDDLLPIQKKKKKLGSDSIQTMWEKTWNQKEQLAFINGTNVQFKFKADNKAVLSGFTRKQLSAAVNLLLKYQKTGGRPGKEKYQTERQPEENKESETNPFKESFAMEATNRILLQSIDSRVVICKRIGWGELAALNKSGALLNELAIELSKPGSRAFALLEEQQTPLVMVIQYPVVRIINKENCLKNAIQRKFGVNINCNEDSLNTNHTMVELRGKTEFFISVEYFIFEHISQHQTHTETIHDQSIVELWNTWDERDNVLFFLETNTFMADDTNVLQGFELIHIQKAKTKLKEYSRSVSKPHPRTKNFKQAENQNNMTRLTNSIYNFYTTLDGSTKTGTQTTMTMEVEKGDERRISELIAGTDGVHLKAIQESYDTEICIRTGFRLVLVKFSAESDKNIVQAVEQFLKQFRSIQHYQRTYFLSANHGWRNLSSEEKIKFQCNSQVTVKENGSRLLLKGFLLSKLSLAVDKLEAQMNNNVHLVMTIELNNGDEKRIGGILIGAKGVYIKDLMDLYETTVKIESSGFAASMENKSQHLSIANFPQELNNLPSIQTKRPKQTTTPGPGLVSVTLISKTVENIHKTEQHIWNRIRLPQNHQCECSIGPSHFWRQYNERERIQFQTDMQVTIEHDQSNNSMLTVKAFLKEKLRSAVVELR